jgi:transposase-like protein
MAETRRKFDLDFREGAVRLVQETGKPIAQVARDLGINDGTPGNWMSGSFLRAASQAPAAPADEFSLPRGRHDAVGPYRRSRQRKPAPRRLQQAGHPRLHVPVEPLLGPAAEQPEPPADHGIGDGRGP